MRQFSRNSANRANADENDLFNLSFSISYTYNS